MRPEIVVVAEDARISGGAERVALRSAQGLAQRGYSVSLFTAGKELDSTLDPSLFREVALLGLDPYWNRWFSASSPQKFRTLLSEPGPARAFSEFLSHRDPKATLIHFHGFHTRLTHGVIAAALNAGFPSLLTMHDYGFVCPNATFYDYNEGAICLRRPLSRECWNAPCIHRDALGLKRLRALRTLGQRTVLGIDRRLTHLVAVSNFAAAIVAPYLHPSARQRVVLNPVETKSAPPAEPERAPALLWAGRMTEEKAPVAAAAAAAAAGIPIRFVGSGTEEPAALAANPDAEFLGWRSAEEVAALTARSRALVLTSRWYETASLVVLDAMSRGIPPVVPRHSAATEWFQDGVEGLVFDSDDPASLAGTLERLKDDALVARLGRAAHARFWADPPTLDRHLDELERLYAEVRA